MRLYNDFDEREYMVKQYNPDLDGLYDMEEIHELIREYGVSGAVGVVDISKVPDKKLRTWMEQFEILARRIEEYVDPKRVSVIKYEKRKSEEIEG